jgi:hypothetical protein
MTEHAHIDPLTHVAQPDHPDALADARALAARAIRDIGHAFVGRHASIDQINTVTSTLNALTADLEDGAPRSRN